MSRTPNSGSKTANFMPNSTLKMKNQTPLVTVPSRPSLRKHAFYGILALVTLLGLGMTQSAKANFIETINQGRDRRRRDRQRIL